MPSSSHAAHNAMGSLNKLPVEVLSMICRCLSPQYDQDSYEAQDQNFEARKQVRTGWQALVALNATSRIFHHLAEPLVYQVLDLEWLSDAIYDEDEELTAHGKLIRTLDERHDLAVQVRSLDQAIPNCADVLTEADIELLKSISMRLSMALPDDPDYSFVEADDLATSRFYIELLVAMCPNLERLCLLVEQDGNEDGTHFLSLGQRMRKLGVETVAMDQLRYLRLHTESDWGVDLTTGCYKVLLDLAPNLQTLIINRCHDYGGGDVPFGERQGALSELRSLRFSACAMENEASVAKRLRRIVGGSQKLKRFEYTSQGAYLGEHIHGHFTARQFAELLLPAKATLRHFAIDLSDHSLNLLQIDTDNLLDGATLKPFERLEVVSLDETSFCRHRHSPELSSGSHNEATCLSELLPRGVRKVMLRIYETSRAWEDVARVATLIDHGDLPHMQHLGIKFIRRMHSGLETEVVRTNFEDGKVLIQTAFSTTSVDLHFEEIWEE